MTNLTRGRLAGMVGMVSAVLWLGTVFMQYRYGLFGLDSGPLYPVHQLLAFVALAGMIVGFLGLVWSGAVAKGWGKTAVFLYALGFGLISFTGLVVLMLQTEDSPIFLLYPIGALLGEIGGLLIGIAVLRAKQWLGWQRYVPLASFLIIFFSVSLPLTLGATEGPGMVGELIMGACWFGVALAVWTMSRGKTAVSPAVA